MKKRVLTGIALVLLLVGLPLGLALLEARRSPESVPLPDESTQTLLSPLLRAAAWLPRQLAGGLEYLVTSGQVRRYNEALERKIERLEAENSVLREKLGHYRRLGAVEETARVSDWPRLPATVLARDGKRWVQSMVIDRGADHGLEPGDPVLHLGGVAGMVLRCGRWTSTVQLLAAPQAAVGALALPGRARGIVRGTGDIDRLELVLADPSQRLLPGQRIISSGLDNSIYPRGLPVGLVAREKTNLYGQIIYELDPAVDFRSIEEVLVLLARRVPGDQATTATLAPPPPRPDSAVPAYNDLLPMPEAQPLPERPAFAPPPTRTPEAP